MTDKQPALTFQPIDPESDTTPSDFEFAQTCPCPNPDDQYELELDGACIGITHRACGKPPAWDSDWQDSLSLQPTPVRLTWERDCNGDMWHGEHMCDCHAYAVLDLQAQQDIPGEDRTS